MNPLFHARTKHIELDFHYVRDQVHRKQLTVKFISTKDQLADPLTKPLSPQKFPRALTNLNVHSLLLRLRGRVEDNIKNPRTYHKEHEINQATECNEEESSKSLTSIHEHEGYLERDKEDHD